MNTQLTKISISVEIEFTNFCHRWTRRKTSLLLFDTNILSYIFLLFTLVFSNPTETKPSRRRVDKK